MDDLLEVQKKIEMIRFQKFRESLYDKPILRNLFLEVTSLCNARCEHCGSSCGDNKPEYEIESKYLKKTL